MLSLQHVQQQKLQPAAVEARGGAGRGQGSSVRYGTACGWQTLVAQAEWIKMVRVFGRRRLVEPTQTLCWALPW
jgi:hypothetical protein